MSSIASATFRPGSIMSEYVAIADAFVDRDETGMVNAVLDQIARQLRVAEFEHAAG